MRALNDLLTGSGSNDAELSHGFVDEDEEEFEQQLFSDRERIEDVGEIFDDFSGVESELSGAFDVGGELGEAVTNPADVYDDGGAGDLAIDAALQGNGKLASAHARLTQQAQHAHRHDLPERPNYTTHLVSVIIWILVILHLIAVLVWLRAWLRQKRGKKDPTMKALTPGPPQKVGAVYDMDKAFSMPKIELPIKSLTLKQSKA